MPAVHLNFADRMPGTLIEAHPRRSRTVEKGLVGRHLDEWLSVSARGLGFLEIASPSPHMESLRRNCGG